MSISVAHAPVLVQRRREEKLLVVAIGSVIGSFLQSSTAVAS
jgi:hypothetical protein